MNLIRIGLTTFTDRRSRPSPRSVFVHVLGLAFASVSLASSPPWTVSGVQDTGVKRNGETLAAISSTGEIYSVIDKINPASGCPAPTLAVGDSAVGSSCVMKFDASGRTIFAAQIGGGGVEELQLDGAGNAYIAGAAGPTGAGFETTPGAYETSPPGVPDSFVCKLSGTDGHPLYCTFVDFEGALAVGQDGKVYVAGLCNVSIPQIRVEKLNTGGTALEYRISTNDAGFNGPYPAHLATDANGNLFIAQGGLGFVKLDASGAIVASDNDLGNEVPIALALDARGNPQLLLEDKANDGQLRLRRYTAELSAILFDTPLFSGTAPVLNGVTVEVEMAIDPAGVTTIVGGTSGANLTPIRPTQSCYSSASPQALSASAYLARFDDSGNVMQSTYLNRSPNFAPGNAIVFNSTGASVLYFDQNWELLQLGPAASEIALSCIGNGASFAAMPLAPNEIVSLFGVGIGPAQPAVAQPLTNGGYPFQLGGIGVMFDGTAAPLLYAADGQINVVTPRELQNKTTTHVCVTANEASTNCIDVPVQPAAPGIFGSGQLNPLYVPFAAAVNQDGSINSAQNPAPFGSIVSLFATGLGTVTPALPDGSITPYPAPAQDLNLRVTYNYSRTPPLDAQTLYVGPAPLEIEGLAQINVVVPPVGIADPGPYFQVSTILPGGQIQVGSPVVTIWIK